MERYGNKLKNIKNKLLRDCETSSNKSFHLFEPKNKETTKLKKKTTHRFVNERMNECFENESNLNLIKKK
jgi:hypothetical protein